MNRSRSLLSFCTDKWKRQTIRARVLNCQNTSKRELARAVLEVRSREVPFILEHGQTVGRLVYERMLARPDQLYGQGIGSNYQAQSLKLSKHFRA